MPMFVGTFGANHLNGMGADKYVLIEADDMAQAVRVMQARFADKYAFVYRSAEEAGVERWSLQCVNVTGEPLTAYREGVE
jgi:hypothetical protein